MRGPFKPQGCARAIGMQRAPGNSSIANSALGAVLWTPATLTGLYAWYSADSRTLSGSNVTQHTDLSGAGRHLLPPATNQTLVAAAVNGKDVFRIGASVAQAKTSQTNLTTTQVLVMVTFKPAAALGATSRLFDWTAYNTGCWLGIGSPDTQRGGGARWTAGSPYGQFKTGTNAAWQMLGLIRDTTWVSTWGKNGGQAVWLNGDFANFAGNANPTVSDTAAFTAGSMSVGSDQGGGSAILSTDWRQLVICNAAYGSNTTERQKLEGYLMHDIGLQASLPSDHPYLTTPPYV